MIGIKPKIFPNLKIHGKRLGTCRQIIQSVGTDIDSKGRLWMIDSGSTICHPKLIIYDLLYLNEGEVLCMLNQIFLIKLSFTEVQFQTFNNIKDKTFNSILVDPILAGLTDSRAYISLVNEEFLFVYSFNERKIGKLKFM